MGWTRVQNKELIRIYREHALLYRPQYLCGNEREKREEAFFEITYEIQSLRPGTTIQEVKSRIKNLRTQYFREKKKRAAGAQENDVKLWCYEHLRFLDDETDEDEQHLDSTTEIMKLEAEDIGAESVENDEIDTSDGICSEDYLENEFIQEDQMLCNEELDVENAIKSPDIIQPSFSTHDLEDDNAVGENLPESLTIKLNETLDRTNTLLSRLNYIKQSKNRPFVENLLLDLNKLPKHTLRRAKWKITDIVYKAQQEQRRRDRAFQSN